MGLSKASYHSLSRASLLPKLYRRIEDLENSIEGIFPKEPQVLEALLIEGWDLTPALQSYAQVYTPVEIALELSDYDGEEPMDTYHENLRDRVHRTPSHFTKFRQRCSLVKDAITKNRMVISHLPILFETADHRLVDLAVEEVKENVTYQLYKIADFYPEIYDGEVDWMGKREEVR